VITVLSAPAAPDLEGKTFFCSTADISVGGLRFHVHRALPLESLLKLLVALVDPLQTFTHVGRVIWLRETEEGRQYAVGVQFTDGEPEVNKAWQQLVAEKLTQGHGPSGPPNG
jgi:Tfp pilus assembly protein PilZ